MKLLLLSFSITFISVLSESVCDEVDTVFIFNTSEIISDTSDGGKITEFIENIVFEASSEKSGVGFIVYGDLPSSYDAGSIDDVTILGLKQTKVRSTKQTQRILDETLAVFFSDLFDEGLDPTNYASFELALESAQYLFAKESKRKTNKAVLIMDPLYYVKDKCVNTTAQLLAQDDIDDDTGIYFVNIDFNYEGDIELDHVFDCKHGGNESEEYDALSELYEITCPTFTYLEETKSNWVKFNKKDQWIDEKSVVSCTINTEYNRQQKKVEVLDTSIMMVDIKENDEMSFEKGYILMTMEDDLEAMEEKGCTFAVLKITSITKVDEEDEDDGLYQLGIAPVGIFDYVSTSHIRYDGETERRRLLNRRRLLTLSTDDMKFSREWGPLTATACYGIFCLSMEDATIGLDIHARMGFSFGVNLDLDIEWCWFWPCGVDYFKFSIYGGLDMFFNITTSFTGILTLSVDLAEIQWKDPPLTFMLWIIPVVVIPKLTLGSFFELDATYAKLVQNFGFHFEPSFEAGVEYDDGFRAINTWSLIQDEWYYFDVRPVAGSGEACPSCELTVGLELKVGGSLYGVVFVYIITVPALKGELALPSRSCAAKKGDDVCTADDVPTWVEINPSLVFSLGVGYEVEDVFITALMGLAGINNVYWFLDERPLYEFDQICLPRPNELTTQLVTCCAIEASVTDDPVYDVRLAGYGSTPYEGRIEVVRNGYWKTVCGDSYTGATGANFGDVFCRQLASQNGLDTPISHELYYDQIPYGEGAALIGAGTVTCDGTESTLQDATCHYGEWFRSPLLITCNVFCSTMGKTCNAEMQSTIKSCAAVTAAFAEAGYECLSCGGAQSYAGTPFSTGRPFDDDDCYYLSSSAESVCDGYIPLNYPLCFCEDADTDCEHDSDLSILCITAERGDIRLAGSGSTDYEGRVEVYDGAKWGSITDTFIEDSSDYIGKVICRTLDLDTHDYVLYNVAPEAPLLEYGYGSGPLLMDEIYCDGSETNIFDCNHKAEEYVQCDVDQALGIKCNAPPEGMIRLNGDNATAWEGRIEVSDGTQWGTVCSDGFYANAANVACRQLGHGEYITLGHGESMGHGEYMGSGPILMDNIDCDGTELKLMDCTHDLNDNDNCGHWKDISIICTPAENQLRLTGTGSTAYEGRVEIYQNPRWGTICNDNFGQHEAEVVCRQLGLSASGVLFYNDNYDTPYGRGDGEILMDDVQCGNGTQMELVDCQYNVSHNCEHYKDVSVVCSAATKGDVRLSEGGVYFKGRIEIYDGYYWSTICSNGITDDSDAIGEVICRQLSFEEHGYVLFNKQNEEGTSPFPAYEEGVISMTNIVCDGSEERVIDCTFDPDTSGCDHDQDLGIKCLPIDAGSAPNHLDVKKTGHGLNKKPVALVDVKKKTEHNLNKKPVALVDIKKKTEHNLNKKPATLVNVKKKAEHDLNKKPVQLFDVKKTAHDLNKHLPKYNVYVMYGMVAVALLVVICLPFSNKFCKFHTQTKYEKVRQESDTEMSDMLQ